ncbi:MAG: PepSY domain-containing protein [Spongiibacteraceae bacterium]|jgi:uncharacterized membrane protein YkoI|nr:PepSY domain-containing protein [Spongiibacteraceae bacterium]
MKRILTIGACALLFSSVTFAFGDDDEKVSADALIKAVQTAVATYPGEISDVEVDKKRDKLVIEVEVVGADGEREIHIDAATGEVINK